MVAGLPLAEKIFRTISPRCRFHASIKDGAYVKAGRKLATVMGPARAILAGERPALNALQHLSGIATQVRQWVWVPVGDPQQAV